MHRSILWMSMGAMLLCVPGTAASARASVPQALAPDAAPNPEPATTPASSLDRNDPVVARTVTAMTDASTWGHPDLFGEFTGMKLYAAGNYKGALKYFGYGARYADKLSQLSIGLMYENGQGVQQDHVAACAWLALASERNYPSFVATRDRVCKALTPAQHDQAVAVLDKLMPEYGDAVAKRRMTVELNLTKMEMTGSRLGFNSGVSQYVGSMEFGNGGAPIGPMLVSNCGGPTLYIGGVGIPKAGCGSSQFFNATLWNPQKYFAARDAQWRGTVTVGTMKDLDAPRSSTKASRSKDAPPPASAATEGH
jgi:hypothetical protein